MDFASRQRQALVLFILLLFILVPIPAISASPKPVLDIKPDCDERPIQIDEIVALANRPETKTVIQFLSSIPKDALQTFTFVPTTNSLQHHKVDENWPRVLRMRADGKIAMSFVCNPASQDYGTVEILHFEETPKVGWQSVRLKFDNHELTFKGQTENSFVGISAGNATASADRVVRQSPTCLNCHGVGPQRADLRPIFPAYPNWPGFYGSEDDTLFHGERELSNFQQFKVVAQKDPCYSTLPWPKVIPPGYEYYPYHALTRPNSSENPYTNETYIRDLKTTNYHVRPNLKFTDTMSHLLARRLSARFSEQPDYQKVASLIAMETLECEGTDLDAEISKVVGKRYKKTSFIESMSMMDPRSANSRSRRLYNLGRALGIEPDEWTLNFNRPLDPEYGTGVQGAYGQDTSVARMVQSLLFEKLATDVPDLRGNFRLSRGISAFFKGQNFSCVDDLGGAIEFDSTEKRLAMCSALSRSHRERVGEKMAAQIKTRLAPIKSPEPARKPSLKIVRTKVGENFKSTSVELVKQGETVARTYCVSCHGASSYLPSPYHFLKSQGAFHSALNTDPTLLFRVMAYIDSARMPMGQTLADSDRRALQHYLFKASGAGQ